MLCNYFNKIQVFSAENFVDNVKTVSKFILRLIGCVFYVFDKLLCFKGIRNHKKSYKRNYTTNKGVLIINVIKKYVFFYECKN